MGRSSMKFEIKKGKGWVSIGYDTRNRWESLTLKDPATFLWDDCDDPGDENLVLLPANSENLDLVNHALKDIDFDIDYNAYRIEDLFSDLQPLLNLLKDGKYELSFSTQELFKIYHSVADFADERLDRKEVEKENNKYDEKLKQNIVYDYTFHGAYDGTHRINVYYQPFIAWKSGEEIDIDIVKQYENRIISGERPFAIIFTGKYGDTDFHEYILDGHHKLYAYENLKIDPPCVLIRFLPEKTSEISVDIEDISRLIFPWQFNHIYDNWNRLGKTEYFKNNPESSLKRHIKNGFVTFLYPDNRKRAEGFYINDFQDGDFKHWYENGKISNLKSFSLGKPTGRLVYYYDDELSDHEDNLDCRDIGYEFIYKDGELRISKKWNRDGKIKSISIHEPKSIKEIPLTDEIIGKYSTEKYRISLREKEVTNKTEKGNTQLKKAIKEEITYSYLKFLILPVIIFLIIIYYHYIKK